MRRRLKGKSTAASGLLEGSASVRCALSLSEGPSSVGRVPGMPVGNDTAASTDCPCGWKPPLYVHRSVRQARIKTHWYVYQGRRPPNLDADVRSVQLYQRLATVRGGPTDAATVPRLGLANGKPASCLPLQPLPAHHTWK